MLLGCIGDDFTGSSDLANTLAKGGMRTVQYTGVPTSAADPDVDAGVVALKTRSIPPADAVEQSLAALAWLQNQGCQQFFFKYCSTFDSTPDGNIGPVADALAIALQADQVIVCPAFPVTGRSIYQGHLFVNGKPLHESGMEHHPLTPMTDPDLRRWLGQQSQFAIGHVDAATVFDGSATIATALENEAAEGRRHVVVDAIRDEDLIAIGRAAKDLPLITGGSGVALGLPANFGCVAADVPWIDQPGRYAALAGSCSEATRHQVAQHAVNHPTIEVVAADVLEGRRTAEATAQWLLDTPGLPLAYSSADPAVVDDVQATFGRERAATGLEQFFAGVARLIVEGGVTRLVAAGGETSGAVVEALGVASLALGPEIDPGVPVMRAGPDLAIALKSGNFGAPDFFDKAGRIMESGQ